MVFHLFSFLSLFGETVRLSSKQDSEEGIKKKVPKLKGLWFCNPLSVNAAESLTPSAMSALMVLMACPGSRPGILLRTCEAEGSGKSEAEQSDTKTTAMK